MQSNLTKKYNELYEHICDLNQTQNVKIDAIDSKYDQFTQRMLKLHTKCMSAAKHSSHTKLEFENAMQNTLKTVSREKASAVQTLSKNTFLDYAKFQLNISSDFNRILKGMKIQKMSVSEQKYNNVPFNHKPNNERREDDEFYKPRELQQLINNNNNNGSSSRKISAAVMKCGQCNQTFNESDWGHNVQMGSNANGYKHVKCPLYIEAMVANISQYTYNSVGSCTLNALECALQLLMGETPSVLLASRPLELTMHYQGSKHMAVMDIFPKVKRYNHNLQQLDYIQKSVNDFPTIVNKLQCLGIEYKTSVSLVITKPPETILMHYFFNNDEYLNGKFILYDSHPRPNLTGAHFLIFESNAKALKYLQELYPFVELGPEFQNLIAQQTNLCDARYFTVLFISCFF